ncbi:MAG: HNH endonuclease [Roseburia sp.]|nr:HNH endonuclease [Roseburia sp.]
MPYKPKRPCRYPGCAKLTDGVYCGEHQRLMNRHYDSFQRGYDGGKRYGGDWRTIRNRHIKRRPLCERCFSEGRCVTAELVHHIKPLSQGGTHDESNLMSLCRSCHNKIHSELGDRRGG